MQRKTGRAGVLKIIRRGAAVGILAALLFGLLAGVLLPACAKAAQRAPAGTSIKAAKPTQALTFPLAGRCWLSDAYGWREDPFTGDETFHRGVDLACAEGTPVLAALAGTVSYELTCAVSKRVPRVYLQGGKVVEKELLLRM